MIRRHWDKYRPQLIKQLARGRFWARQNLPPGSRIVVGTLLIAGGMLAFLPVLGLWMIPLGIMVAALDVRPFMRRVRVRRRIRVLR